MKSIGSSASKFIVITLTILMCIKNTVMITTIRIMINVNDNENDDNEKGNFTFVIEIVISIVKMITTVITAKISLISNNKNNRSDSNDITIANHNTVDVNISTVVIICMKFYGRQYPSAGVQCSVLPWEYVRNIRERMVKST